MPNPHLPSRIFLIDRTPAMAAAWNRCFDEHDSVQAIEGDYFSEAADAMVSPANSFGIMDGGLDLAIRNTLGFEVQKSVQHVIVDEHHGELPVGQAIIVPTDHERWAYLIAAPTMRVPESIARTTHAYLAFRAVLLAVARFNQTASDTRIDSIVCPGLGTGIGAMDYERCALQMRMAYRQLSAPARIPSFSQIHGAHAALVRS